MLSPFEFSLYFTSKIIYKVSMLNVEIGFDDRQVATNPSYRFRLLYKLALFGIVDQHGMP